MFEVGLVAMLVGCFSKLDSRPEAWVSKGFVIGA